MVKVGIAVGAQEESLDKALRLMAHFKGIFEKYDTYFGLQE